MGPTDIAAARQAPMWFAAWAVPGVCFALLISQLGMVTLPIGIGLALVLGVRRVSRPHWPGLAAGVGLLLVYVGATNWGGPGERCGEAAGVTSCVELVNPWPWFIVGVVLIAAALGLEMWLERRAEVRDAQRLVRERAERAERDANQG